MSDKASGSSAAPVSGRRRLLFAGVALLIPVLFFVLLEVALRAFGLYREHPLFISSPGQPSYMQASPEVVKRFFSNPDAAPAVNIETGYFLAERPQGGLRIVVQGGSSAAGFPYGYGASIAGMLEQRLRRVMPGRPVEVISTAMSAVNSYTLLDFADEIIDIRPNVVMIYAGHIEYLGVLGVGSALSSDLSPALTRATMRLRRFAVYQLMERLIGSSAPDQRALDGGGRTLMARIARDKAIAYQSDTYAQGLAQFEGNLARLIERYRRAGIAVVIGTLVSNEADLAPFVGGSTMDAAGWQGLYEQASAALAAGELARAETLFDQAIAADDGAADAWYGRAQVQAQRGDHAGARELFLAAKDRDQLRFRAPEAFNDVVRRLASEYGAALADVQAAFVAASPEGVVGESLLLEHVHPNLDGYFLMADAYFDALFESGMLVDNGGLPSDEQARREIPVSEVDRLFGEYKLERIVNDWPFVDEPREPNIPAPTNDIENLAFQMYSQNIGWPQAMARQMQHYREQGNAAEALRVALILADALPFAPQPQFAAGTSLISAKRPREAVRYLERGVGSKPNDLNMLLAHGHALILSGRAVEAQQSLERVLALDPNNATARDALAQIRKRLGE